MALAILINGLVLGGGYAMLALGFSLAFGVARILNLAHTAFYMIAAYIIYAATIMFGIHSLLSIILAILGAGVIGVACYKLCFDRVKEQMITVLIISLALGMLFQEVVLVIFSGYSLGIAPFIPGFVEIAGVRVTYQHLFAVGASIVLLGGVWLLLLKTRLGNAIRAVSQDREIANLMGINVSQIGLIVMGISAALAGVAAVIVTPIYMADPFMWMSTLIIVLAAVVLGGFGSIVGSVTGAYILGFVETLVVFLLPMGGYLKGAIALTAMVVILLIKPEGLFGVVFEEERL